MAETEEQPALRTDGQSPVVTFKKRNAKAKGRIRERPAIVQAASDSDDSSSSGDEAGRRVKRRKNNSGVITATTAKDKSTSNIDLYSTVFTADRNAAITNTNDATKSVNWYDEDPKVPPARSVGPVKASSNVRTITVTDFAPDVCKDYKQTGFCGFGE
jgi:RING finger protein 113A